MGKKYILNVQDSPTFGKTLVVDINPVKVCNFNCLYCDVGPTTEMILERRRFYPITDIHNAINQWIQENEIPDCIQLTGSGEPALYEGFGELVDYIKNQYPSIKITAYTNASLFSRSDVREEFSKCDFLKMNLNSVIPAEYKQINRHHGKLNLSDILDGIKTFRASYQKDLWLFSIFLSGINDSPENIKKLANFIEELNPTKHVILNRTIEGKHPPIEADKLAVIKQIFETVSYPTIITF